MFRDLLDDIRRDAQATDHVIVDHHYPAAGDRPHGQFLPARNAELAHEEDVKRGTESGCHLIRHGHPAAGKAKNDDVRAIPVVLEEAGQVSASIPAVTEETVWHDLCPVLDALLFARAGAQVSCPPTRPGAGNTAPDLARYPRAESRLERALASEVGKLARGRRWSREPVLKSPSGNLSFS